MFLEMFSFSISLSGELQKERNAWKIVKKEMDFFSSHGREGKEEEIIVTFPAFKKLHSG